MGNKTNKLIALCIAGWTIISVSREYSTARFQDRGTTLGVIGGYNYRGAPQGGRKLAAAHIEGLVTRDKGNKECVLKAMIIL